VGNLVKLISLMKGPYIVRKDSSGYIYITFVVLFWASTAAVGKLLLADLGSLPLLFLSCLFATSSLFIIVLLRNKVQVVRQFRLRDYLTFLYMGFIGVFLYTFLLFEALRYLRAQEAFILNYLWPIMVVIFSTVILKEKFTLRKCGGVVISFFGVLIVLAPARASLQFGSLKGVAFAVGCAISYGLFSVLGKRRDYDRYVSMMFYYLFASIFSAVPVLMRSGLPRLSIAQLLGVAWLGVFANGVAFAFWFLSLRHGDTARMSSLVFLTPFLSLVYIHFLLGEEILFTSLLGLTLIVLGILIQHGGRDRAFDPDLPHLEQY